jgi:multisubunit Na+/H+ antiporter MnhB subunit
MMQRMLSAPEIALIGGTRVALGMGIGLLLSGRLSRDQRKAAGLALTMVGALTTIPLAAQVINRSRNTEKRVLPAA